MKYEFQVSIAAPVARVWATLTDVERMPEWTESMTRVRRLDDGPLAVGSSARIEQPKLRPMVYTVTELVPEQTFTWAASTPGLRVVATHRLTAGDRDVTLVNVVEVTGLLAPLLPPSIRERTRRYVELEAEGLKRQAEGH
jgi:uncharacterized protein YndB with AHSA1/START domain